MGRTCPHCCEKIEDDSRKFCPFCGLPVADDLQLVMKVNKVVDEYKGKDFKSEPAPRKEEPAPRRKTVADDEDDYVIKNSYQEKKSNTGLIVTIIIIILVLLAVMYFIFFKAV